MKILIERAPHFLLLAVMAGIFGCAVDQSASLADEINAPEDTVSPSSDVLPSSDSCDSETDTTEEDDNRDTATATSDPNLETDVVDTEDLSTETETDSTKCADAGTDNESETDTAVNEDSVVRICTSQCTDFPDAPILETELTPDEINLFSDKDSFSSPGPCVVEPQLSDDDQPGAMFPADWLRPRFRFTPTGDTDLFEIRLQADRQLNDLVVYTRETTWVMPAEIWDGLTKSVIDEPITVTVRGINSLDPETPFGTRGTFLIAPVKAGGKMVYWATTSARVEPDAGKLAGFAVGEDTVKDTLTVADVGDRDLLREDGVKERAAAYGVDAGCVQCIGCHTAVPDGKAVAFGDHWPWNVIVASIDPSPAAEVPPGAPPAYLSRGAELLLNQPWLGMPTFSKAHYNPEERILVTTYGERSTEVGGSVGFTETIPSRDVLVWFDLMTDAAVYVSPDYPGDIAAERNRLIKDALGTGFGFISLGGETLSIAAPDWSNDGTKIVYTAASKTQDGRISGGPAQTDVDLHMVPYNDGAGGTVSCVLGACEKDAAEYYPSFSSDDRLIAFNKEADFRSVKTVQTQFSADPITIDGATADVYYRPHAEIYFIPTAGGTPVRIRANDPPRCTEQTSPGIINSWPKWSPDVKTSPAEFGPKRSFYWIVFSSARAYPEQFIVEANLYSPKDTRASQLYMAAVVRNEQTGEYVTYPAVYIWNQEKTTSNLTPAWDNFSIPQDNTP